MALRGSGSRSGVSAIFRHSRWDAVLVGLAFVHGAALLARPSVLLIGAGLWWNANTIAHNFIHLPFFRARWMNQAFSILLTLLLGVPQALWKARHLAHHAGRSWRFRCSTQLVLESLVLLSLWLSLICAMPAFFLTVYIPGCLLGLVLCALHGYYEHWQGTLSHHGQLYNKLFFNDGFHIEHHERPGEHWTRLPRLKVTGTGMSRWPPVLRWLDHLSLDTLEALVLRSRFLQAAVLRPHERAFRRLVGRIGPVNRVVVVGGGLFPRTALILRKLWSNAQIVLLDANAANLQRARPFLDGKVQLINSFFDGTPIEDADLVIIPLAFVGQRSAVYSNPPGAKVVVHDWIWRRRGKGVIVSWFLLKRLNLVQRSGA